MQCGEPSCFTPVRVYINKKQPQPFFNSSHKLFENQTSCFQCYRNSSTECKMMICGLTYHIPVFSFFLCNKQNAWEICFNLNQTTEFGGITFLRSSFTTAQQHGIIWNSVFLPVCLSLDMNKRKINQKIRSCKTKYSCSCTGLEKMY